MGYDVGEGVGPMIARSLGDGQGVIVDDPDEAKHGLQLLMDKHFPHLKPDVDYESTTDTDLKVTAVLRLDVESWSGKEKKG